MVDLLAFLLYTITDIKKKVTISESVDLYIVTMLLYNIVTNNWFRIGLAIVTAILFYIATKAKLFAIGDYYLAIAYSFYSPIGINNIYGLYLYMWYVLVNINKIWLFLILFYKSILFRILITMLALFYYFKGTLKNKIIMVKPDYLEEGDIVEGTIVWDKVYKKPILNKKLLNKLKQTNISIPIRDGYPFAPYFLFSIIAKIFPPNP
ncbi:NEQ066 [Nanoarchaeum equitans Kin4-M]|uniref:NEQ066 n=1 Tax=Nanoarchaeum equitans (strain Kin4-M) TaxID=228908 RepID=Q74N76_NANEQ|nr:NEQ066 [Nanoarchaeum equitans Kin4-M]